MIDLLFECLCEIDTSKSFLELERLNARWLKKLRVFDISECACTALFVVVKDIGDGVSVVLSDGVPAVTIDKKIDTKEEDFRSYIDTIG